MKIRKTCTGCTTSENTLRPPAVPQLEKHWVDCTWIDGYDPEFQGGCARLREQFVSGMKKLPPTSKYEQVWIGKQ